jgi:hypothetical protein
LAEIPERLMQGGAGFVEGMAALQLNVAPDSFHALKMTFAMIGLVGIYLLYRAAEALLGRSSAGAFWALMLYPTVLFWSGIFGKDPLVLLGIAVYVLGVVQVSTQRSPRHLGMVLAGVALASAVRVWMGPILLLPCVLVVLARLRSVLWRWAMTAGLAVVLASLATVTMERLSIDDAEDLVQATRMVTDNFGTSNSALQRDVEVNSTWDLVARTPQGLFDTYFRPLPGDVDNLFGLLAGFENLFLLAMAGWALTRFRFAYLKNAMFYWSVLLLLTWGLAYSLVTYRDLGTAVRFKLQILPVLLGVIGFLIQRRRVYGVPAATRMMAVERAA